MRSLATLITKARGETDNLDFNTTSGLQNREFIEWARKAQRKLQALVVGERPEGLFKKQVDLQAVANQAAYANPADLFQRTHIMGIWFSPSGQERDYYSLDLKTDKQSFFGTQGDPIYYVRGDESFELMPAPQSSASKIRVIYRYAIPEPSLRGGQISAVTQNTTLRTISALTIAAGGLIATEPAENDYLTVVDAFGNVKMRGVPYTAVNTGTGVVTLAAGFSYLSSESIAANDYVCFGKNSSTHSKLPDDCEQFLIDYMAFRAERRDANLTMSQLDAELTKMAQEYLVCFGQGDDDVKGIPILDEDYLDFSS